MNGFYGFVVGWFLIAVLFTMSLRAEGTKTITYYVLWLSIVLTLVAHADTLRSLIAATGVLTPGESGSGQTARQLPSNQTQGMLNPTQPPSNTTQGIISPTPPPSNTF